jgi:two-component system, OmpR family, sensor histidine kinase VicK
LQLTESSDSVVGSAFGGAQRPSTDWAPDGPRSNALIGIEKIVAYELIRGQPFGLHWLMGLNRIDDHTEIVKGREAVSSAVTSFFRNAKTGMDICTTSVDLSRVGWTSAVADAYLNVKSRGGRLRLLTRIDSHNSRQCEKIAKTVELRHLEGIRGNFGVSDTEYMAGTGEPALLEQLIYSDSPAFVNHHQAVFEMMWENGVPAEQRIQEIELGLPPSETRIIRNAAEAARLARGLIESSKREVLIVLASPAVLARNAGDFRFLVEMSRERGFKIRILAPIGGEAATKEFEGIEWRPIAGINAGIAIYDGIGMLLSQYSNTGPDGDGQVVSNIFTTNRQFVGAMTSIFEAMWDESELRQAEGRSRRMAEVAQDILAHDIRNYNQVAMLNAESLEGVLNDPQSKELLASVLDAIRGSTSLIDKTRELGHILSQKEVTLVSLRLNESLVRALSLIRQANPDRELDITSKILAADVLADDLLDEVFVNILSNAVKYTDGKKVPVEISLEEVDAEFGTPKKFWKLTIADHGKGMANELKKEDFTRYSASETGSGLGLSIVRALVVNRYAGTLRFKDRVEGDLTKGTAVEVWLPKAEGHGSPRPI